MPPGSQPTEEEVGLSALQRKSGCCRPQGQIGALLLPLVLVTGILGGKWAQETELLHW
jgi:hypothetical protein